MKNVTEAISQIVSSEYRKRRKKYLPICSLLYNDVESSAIPQLKATAKTAEIGSIPQNKKNRHPKRAAESLSFYTESKKAVSGIPAMPDTKPAV